MKKKSKKSAKTLIGNLIDAVQDYDRDVGMCAPTSYIKEKHAVFMRAKKELRDALLGK